MANALFMGPPRIASLFGSVEAIGTGSVANQRADASVLSSREYGRIHRRSRKKSLSKAAASASPIPA